MKQPHCPICQRMFDASKSSALPFCSDRCRQIDLGRWLRESYGIAVERPEEDQAGSDYSQTSE